MVTSSKSPRSLFEDVIIMIVVGQYCDGDFFCVTSGGPIIVLCRFMSQSENKVNSGEFITDTGRSLVKHVWICNENVTRVEISRFFPGAEKDRTATFHEYRGEYQRTE